MGILVKPGAFEGQLDVQSEAAYDQTLETYSPCSSILSPANKDYICMYIYTSLKNIHTIITLVSNGSKIKKGQKGL